MSAYSTGIFRAVKCSALTRGLAVVLSFGLSQAALPVAQAAAAEGTAPGNHLVGTAEIAAKLLEAAKTREARVRLFQDALSRTEVEQKAASLGLSAARLRAAVPHLSDSELQDLSRRAARAQDVVAGHHDDSEALVLVGLLLLLAGIAVLAAVADDDGWWQDDCDCWW